MSTPATSTRQVDVGEAFGLVFRSRNWFATQAVGALCLLFFWLFLIPLFILLGYFVETARTFSRGARELPPWNNISTKLGEGFLLSVVLYTLPYAFALSANLYGQFRQLTRSATTESTVPGGVTPAV
jgi:hypothetical protein